LNVGGHRGSPKKKEAEEGDVVHSDVIPLQVMRFTVPLWNGTRNMKKMWLKPRWQRAATARLAIARKNKSGTLKTEESRTPEG
jgi:hypothetical protein